MEQVSPVVLDETVAALSDHIHLETDKEWTAVLAEDAMLHIVARVSNRVISGLELCRNPEFLRTCMSFPVEVFKTAIMLNIVPEFARGFLFNLFSNVDKHVARASIHIRPLIDARKLMGDTAPVRTFHAQGFGFENNFVFSG
jgi:hypothetical protein